MATPILPIINPNGTHYTALKDQLMDAYDALEKAAEVLKRAAPNGRDYYPKPGLIELATQQHMLRLKIVRDLQDNLLAEMEGIDAQMEMEVKE